MGERQKNKGEVELKIEIRNKNKAFRDALRDMIENDETLDCNKVLFNDTITVEEGTKDDFVTAFCTAIRYPQQTDDLEYDVYGFRKVHSN